jgi:hypothetical protein
LQADIMAKLAKEYRREPKKVLPNKDPDKLIEFSKQWASRADNHIVSKWQSE